MNISERATHPWNSAQKISFRFFFILYCVFEGPWTFLYVIPKADHLLRYYFQGLNVVSQFCNKTLFHIAPATKPPNGNGDYPEQWMIVYTSLVLATIGCVIWSLADRKRADYRKLNYWFCLGIRYFIILNGFE